MKFTWLAPIALIAAPAFAADIGVSIGVNQPGLYGQINIGGFPAPQVIYPQPVVIQPAPVAVVQAPIYLHVPPGHERRWARHCAEYGACGRPVLFVRDNWYQQVYAPRYRGGDRDWREGGDRDGGWRGDRDHGGHGHGHGRD